MNDEEQIKKIKAGFRKKEIKTHTHRGIKVEKRIRGVGRGNKKMRHEIKPETVREEESKEM